MWIIVDEVSPRISADVHFLRQISQLIAVESKLRLQFLSAAFYERYKIPLFPPSSWARRTDTRQRLEQEGIRGRKKETERDRKRERELSDISAER